MYNKPVERDLEREHAANQFPSIPRIGGLSMFKIGEFSKLMQVSVRMLRHYD